MKILHSNGKDLTVYDAIPLMKVSGRDGLPVKHNGWQVMDEDSARTLLRELLDSGRYVKTTLQDG